MDYNKIDNRNLILLDEYCHIIKPIIGFIMGAMFGAISTLFYLSIVGF